ncbi:MAG: yhdW 2 [Chlamydiales bacterium]|nr:yhdW 2 [Chlamydiales bacterium]
MERLQRLTGRAIAFADHKIGSEDQDGNWVLNEVFKDGQIYKQDIDLAELYFNSKLLHNWSGIFGQTINIGVSDRYSDNSLTDEPLLGYISTPQDLYSTTTSRGSLGYSVSLGTNHMVAVGRGLIEFFDFAGSGWARTSSFTTADSANPLVATMWEAQNLAVIGYWVASSNAGSISCYQYNSTAATWSSFTLSGTMPTVSSGNLFGSAIASSRNFLAVGAYGDSSFKGAVYVYDIGSTVWTKLIAGTSGESSFGVAVAIEDTRLVIGSNGTTSQGCVYIFDYNGISWVQTQRIEPSDPAASKYFGCSVAVSGDRIAVGAYGDSGNTGTVYIFEKQTGSTPWVQSSKIIPADGAGGDIFGNALDLKGNTLIVSSPQKSVNDSTGTIVSGAGQVYLFEKKSNGWGLINTITKPNLSSSVDSNINTGNSVALNQQYALIGVPGDDTTSASGGKALVYRIKDTATALEHYDDISFDVDQVSSITDGTGSATLLAGICDVKVSGKYTYAISTTDQSLTIFDTSNPFNPNWKGHISLGGAPTAFDVYENYVYVCVPASNWVRIIDVTNPASPTLANTLMLTTPRMLKVTNSKLYVHSAGDTSLRVYTLGTPSSPVQSSILTDATHLAAVTAPNGMYIEGYYLYITNSSNKITILNINNSPPTYVTEITAVTATPQALAAKDNYLYVLGNTGNSIEIYNVFSSSTPVLINTLTNSIDGSYLSGLTSISIEGQYAYVSSTSSNAISVIDIFDPPNACVVKEFVYNSNGITALNGVKGIFVSNNFLYTADSTSNALSIFKLHVPTKNTITRGLRFNGSDQRVTIPSFTLSSNAITLEARIYMTFSPWGNTPIFDLGNGASSDNIFLYIPTVRKLELRVFQGGTSTYITGNATIALYTWYHIAAMVDASGNVSMYINGVLDKTGTVSIPNNVTRTANYIAGSNWGGNPFFGGIIKEARIWSGTRTQRQIITNMRGSLVGNENNLIVYYPFSEESGEIVYDMSQQKRNGVLGLSASTTTGNPRRIFINDPYVAKYSLKFNGVDNNVTLSPGITLGTTFTQEA